MTELCLKTGCSGCCSGTFNVALSQHIGALHRTRPGLNILRTLFHVYFRDTLCTLACCCQTGLPFQKILQDVTDFFCLLVSRCDLYLIDLP